MTTERDILRKKTLDFITKEIGPGLVCKYSDRPPLDIEVIPSGSFTLDAALGVGGYAKGRIIELFGYEASGKTMLTLMAISNCQKNGGICAFIDAEHALDPTFAELNGVNMEELYLSQPDYGEQAFDLALALATSGTFDLIVIDSVAALTPKAEIDGDMETNHIGRQARMMSQGLRKLTAVTHKTNTTIMFINQIRQKIGVMYGPDTTTPGGNALKFYASQRLEVSKSSPIKGPDEDPIGHVCKVKIVKNKVAPPFKKAEFRVMYGTGIDSLGELVDLAVDFGLIDKSGAWYSYNGERLGQGVEKAKEGLLSHPEWLDSIRKDLREHLIKK